MEYPLYEHQKKIIKEDKKWCGLFTGTGSAKSRTGLELSEGRTLVICPKQQREDKTWEKNADKFGITCNLTVLSKEDFKKRWSSLSAFDTVIIDECHNNLGVSPETRTRKGVQIPKTSQLFEATLKFLTLYPPKRLYLCSATPVSKPMNMWAIAWLLGKKWNFYAFREKYYIPIRMGMRSIWIPKKDEETKAKLVELVKRFGYTGTLDDFFDVPEQTHKTVYLELTDPQKQAIKEMYESEADPLVRRTKIRSIENGVLYGKRVESVDSKIDIMTASTKLFPSQKIDYILERAQEFPKLLIFANYTAQIEAIAEALRKEGYKVSTLTGSTKDRANLVEDADKSDAHIVIAQSSISSGYQLPSFPCVIFASKSWRYLDMEQGLGRVLRSDHLKKNLYIHLVIKGGVDEDCNKAIMSGQDFAERLTINI